VPNVRHSRAPAGTTSHPRASHGRAAFSAFLSCSTAARPQYIQNLRRTSRLTLCPWASLGMRGSAARRFRPLSTRTQPPSDASPDRGAGRPSAWSDALSGSDGLRKCGSTHPTRWRTRSYHRGPGHPTCPRGHLCVACPRSLRRRQACERQGEVDASGGKAGEGEGQSQAPRCPQIVPDDGRAFKGPIRPTQTAKAAERLILHTE
jgi:hypothetical protein